MSDNWNEHRRLYPEQWNHALVRQKVIHPVTQEVAVVVRVIPSRFGELAALNDPNDHVAYLAVTLTRVN
jgi:hypothetical protein